MPGGFLKTTSHTSLPEVDAWSMSFMLHRGKAPRVLHIGNIANNAYLNAKLLNAAGWDCDVLCNDYYHIMGCPEWEDADFLGDYGDPFYPNWRSVNLHGFQRPPWFAQGSHAICAKYLIARRRNRSLAAKVYWVVMELNRAGLAKMRSAWAKYSQPQGLGQAGDHNRAIQNVVKVICHRVVKLIAFIMRISHKKVLLLTAGLFVFLAIIYFSKDLQQWFEKAPGIIVLAIIFVLGGYRYLYRMRADRSFERHCEELVQKFVNAFPARKDRLATIDLRGYRKLMKRYARLFSQYDAVIGYATAGIFPLLLGKRPFFAYEHGTLRSIPFQADSQGRLCAITYKEADCSFITNCDNINAAHNLQLPYFRFIPHPVNEAYLNSPNAVRLRQEIKERLGADFIAFHPSRQHWESRRHPDWEKGNDIFIRGFARFVAEIAPKAGAVFVDWGQTVAASKDLLEELGVAGRVVWIPPQPNRRMLDYVAASEVLADQFYLGAFGSTTPKALMLGVPAMLYLDEERHRWCFPELPPVLNARTPEDVFAGLQRLYLDTPFRIEIQKKSRDWYWKYHSNAVILSTFSAVMESAMSKSPLPGKTISGG